MAANDLVTVNLEPLKRFQAALAADLQGSGQGPIRAAMKQWGVRFRSAMQERFAQESAGGGDWPPLAASTILARRAGRGMGGGTRQQAMARKQKQINRLEKQRGNLYRQLGKAKKSERVEKLGQQIRAKTAQINKAWKGRQGLATMAGIQILRNTGLLFGALSPTFNGTPGAVEEPIPFGVRVGYGGPAAHPGGRATIADIASYHQAGNGRLPKREVIVATPPDVIAAMAGDMDRGIARMIEQTGNGR
jgi:hypothetical protein